ncbi:MAG TPA: phenylalanine--tRNA ligase subunit beta [Candidatus Paceibacterota bacterium]|nr:phenylalanine--tRNA ligase subunit beta [Candidatus Paceibacterota bacterium]
MKVSYLWLKEYVGETMPPVEELETLLTFHAFEIDGIEQVGDDAILDVKVLPDRGADCLSHRGIAREITSLIASTLTYDPFYTSTPEITSSERVRAHIADTEQCARISFALMTGVTIGESPAWLKQRLSAIGQRSINNVVDATNYVMYALGQPLHAYDAKKLTEKNGTYALGVRMAREGECITTLSQETYTLNAQTQLIVDGHSDVPLSLAGVKGGAHAEVDATTTMIILEAGNFNPQTTRKTAQRFKLFTDAAKRFENGVSPEMVSPALCEVVALILEIAGGVCEGKCDTYPHPARQEKVLVKHARVESVLGIPVSVEVIEDILARIGCLFEIVEGGWSVLPPRERIDICISEDIIAEIGRIYGYEHIPARIPTAKPITEYNARQEYSERVRHFLIEKGFSEVITSSFCEKDEVILLNALASDKGALRSSLRGNVADVLTRNMYHIDLLGIPYTAVFEIGTVFTKDETNHDVVEYTACALGVRTKVSGYTPHDDVILRTVIQELEAYLGTVLGGSMENGIYEYNFSELLTKVPAPTAYTAHPKREVVTFKPYSHYPHLRRDIALWASTDMSDVEVRSCIEAYAGDLLVRMDLFDTFTKDGKTSYAFRLVFQSSERTLTDDEIAETMRELEGALKERGCVIR